MFDVDVYECGGTGVSIFRTISCLRVVDMAPDLGNGELWCYLLFSTHSYCVKSSITSKNLCALLSAPGYTFYCAWLFLSATSNSRYRLLLALTIRRLHCVRTHSGGVFCCVFGCCARCKLQYSVLLYVLCLYAYVVCLLSTMYTLVVVLLLLLLCVPSCHPL